MQLISLIGIFVMFYEVSSGLGSLVVYPTAVIAVAGDSVSITCTDRKSGCIDSWKHGNDISTSTTVYNARYNNGTWRIPKFVAEKYKVIDSKEGVAVLMMNKIELSHAGLYHCICNYTKSSATGNVAVIASEPKFALDYIGGNDQAMTLTCSISFKGSSNASFEISIRDFNGNILGHRNNLPFSRNQHRHSLSIDTNRNVSTNETYFCQVTLVVANPKRIIHYSKNVTFSLDEILEEAKETYEAFSSTSSGRSLSMPVVSGVVLASATVVIRGLASLFRDETLRL